MPTAIDDQGTEEREETVKAQEYAPGELAPVIITQQQVWKPDDLNKADATLLGMLQDFVSTCSTTDEAARRFSVLDTWQNRHMDRGYQYLESNKQGGWNIAGVDQNAQKGNSLAAADDANLYPTNIFSAQGDIGTSALCRGEIQVNFAAKNSKNPQDTACADERNNYKYLWAKTNDSIGLQRDMMGLGWTDCRVVAWTRSVADKARFGENDDGTPRIVEVTTLHGVLESKLPMMVDKREQCSYVQLFEEVDYAVARASYPWMGNKIKPSWGTYGELEFERIARINTRIGIVGKYITGTSGIRETTMGYIWFRPGMYFDDKVQPAQREFLLDKFPDGLFMVVAGADICCCWNESMDDHIALGMYTRGFGQNRRSLGSSDVPLQKRINIWADLWDKFVRGSIPFTALDSDAYNPEAISQLEASPTRYLPVAPQEGQPIADTMASSPQILPIPGFAEMFQWYLGPLIQSIDGMTPSLAGEGEGQDNTVGATQIRLQQALERIATAWIMANQVFAIAVSQAADSCAENGNQEIYDTVPGKGDVSVNPANLRGNTRCYPETINGIPESGAQREAKLLQVLDMANANPQIAALIGTPSNAREIVKGLHLDDVITVDEANAEDGALEDIERLLESEPRINPAWQQLTDEVAQLNQLHEAVKPMAQEAVMGGDPASQEIVDKGQAMESDLQQLQQQLQQTPQYLPSIEVPTDGSLDYQTITATVFSWMQLPDGRNLRRAAAKEPPGGDNWKKWQNVYLYWNANKIEADKLAAANQQPIPPKTSITIDPSKLTGDAQANALMKAGIQSQPEGTEVEQEEMLYTPVSEVKTRIKKRL